jgi:hypothetical protein
MSHFTHLLSSCLFTIIPELNIKIKLLHVSALLGHPQTTVLLLK